MAHHSHKVNITRFNSEPRNHWFHGVLNEVLACQRCMQRLHAQIEMRRLRDERGLYDRAVWGESHVSRREDSSPGL